MLLSPDQSTLRKTFETRTLKLLVCSGGTSRTGVLWLAC